MSTEQPRLVTAEPAWSWGVFHIIAGSFFVFYLLLLFFTNMFEETFAGFSGTSKFLITALTFVFASYLLAMMLYGPIVILKIIFGKIRGEINYVTMQADQLQENLEQDFFTKLVKINFKYLDKYYLQTQVQADKSFLLSSIAAAVGLFILVAGIIMMFKGQTEPAIVTAAAGAFSEFIAAVFFYLYSKTVLEMGKYHQKLVLTQNIGLSLKISEDLPDDDRVEVQKKLIESLTADINKYLTTEVTA